MAARRALRVRAVLCRAASRESRKARTTSGVRSPMARRSTGRLCQSAANRRNNFKASRYASVVWRLTLRSAPRCLRKKSVTNRESSGDLMGAALLSIGDEMPEPRLMPPGDLAEEVLGQLQVALGALETDMPEVGDQQGQFRVQVRVLFVPAQEPVDGECAAKVVETGTPAGPGRRDRSPRQDVV